MSPPGKNEHNAGPHASPDVSGEADARSQPRLIATAEGRGEEPWDPAAAETLTRIYESIADDLAPALSRAKPPSMRAAASVPPPAAQSHQPSEQDRAWLEGRLAAVADRLERSLAQVNPEKSIAALTTRLDRLEQRFDAALKDVALRSDLSSLDEVAARTREIVDWFDQARGQLARLDTIESQLRDLSRRLDEQLRHAPGVDASQIAAAIQAAALHTTTASAPTRPATVEPGASRMDALEDLLREHIDERRRSEELTSTVLTAIENTLAGIGERLEALGPRGLTVAGQIPARDSEPVGPGIEGDALTEAYEKGARALGQRGGFSLDAADYASLQAPRLRDEHAHGDGGIEPAAAGQNDDKDVHEARALEPFRTDLLRTRLRAQAENIRNVVESEAAPPAGKARFAVPRGNLVSLLLAVILLFLAGYLTVDRLLDGRSPSSPQPAGRSTSAPLAGSPAGADTRSREEKSSPGSSGVPANARPDSRPEMVPFNAPLQRQQPTEPVNEEQGRTEAASESTFASMRAFGVAVSNWLQAKPPVVKVSTDPGGRDLAQEPSDANAGLTADGGNELPAAVGSSALRRAAVGGDPVAQFEVGSRFAEGLVVSQDLRQAAAWYQRAAARGYAPAQFRLALLFERGLGVTADPGRAKVWYRRAAEQGNVKAMHNLAVLSAAENAGRPDFAEAVKWFSEAAERGLADSQFNLAVLYETGRGVTRDLSAAYRWFALANAAGDKEAGRRLEAVRTRLLAPEIAAAESAVAAWRPQPLDVTANGLQSSALTQGR